MELTARLSINPSRFASQQTGPIPGWDAPPDVIFKRTDDIGLINEHLLVRSDNVLAGGSRKFHYFRSQMWLQRVQDYLERVYRLIDEAITTGITDIFDEQPPVRLERLGPDILMRECETYWEFLDSHPLAEVAQLAASMRGAPFQRSLRLIGIPSDAVDDSTLDNSRRLAIYINDRHSVRVYAKTTRRVRVEFADRLRTSTADNVPIRDFGQVLLRATQTASEELRSVFSFLPSATDANVESSRNVFQLLGALHRVTNGQSEFEALISALAQNQVVTKVPRDALGPVIRRLRESGVLGQPRQDGRARIYPVARDYRDAALQLGHAAGLIPDAALN
tara:strand:- start:481 stop:1485 length:1005 start_codon:yes stop_codon:yes gene_type:complete